MAINKKLSKEVDALLDRIATALENNHLPELENSVALEHLYWEYREHTGDIQELGVRFRANGKNKKDVTAMTKDKIDHLVKCGVHRGQPDKSDAQTFASNIRHYLNKEISIAKLFGERDRKLRNDIAWQHYDHLGEIAEFAANFITVKTTNKKLKKSNRVPSGFDDHLYNFLNDFSFSRGNTADVIKKYNVTGKLEQLKSMMVSNVTATQWRDSHKENRDMEAERISKLQKRK